jgi:hypothetical protein
MDVIEAPGFGRRRTAGTYDEAVVDDDSTAVYDDVDPGAIRGAGESMEVSSG